MSKTIHSVPDHLTREQFNGLVQDLGFSLTDVLSIHIDVNGVHAVVIERDADGTRVMTSAGYAKHTVHIPVKD